MQFDRDGEPVVPRRLALARPPRPPPSAATQRAIERRLKRFANAQSGARVNATGAGVGVGSTGQRRSSAPLRPARQLRHSASAVELQLESEPEMGAGTTGTGSAGRTRVPPKAVLPSSQLSPLAVALLPADAGPSARTRGPTPLATPGTNSAAVGGVNGSAISCGAVSAHTSTAPTLIRSWNCDGEYARKRDFLIRFARALHERGAPTHHTEELCTFIASALGIAASVCALPTCVFMSFSPSTPLPSPPALGPMSSAESDRGSQPFSGPQRNEPGALAFITVVPNSKLPSHPPPSTPTAASAGCSSTSDVHSVPLGSTSSTGGSPSDDTHGVDSSTKLHTPMTAPSSLAASTHDAFGHAVGHGLGHGFGFETAIVRASGNTQCESLYLVDELGLMVAERLVDVDEADARLADIMRMPRTWPAWAEALCFPLAGAGCALLFYGGGWWDALFAAIFGLFVGLMRHASTTYPEALSKVWPLLAASVVSFLTSVVTYEMNRRGWEVCFFPVVLSSVVWLMSGTSFTVGVIEVANGSITAGVARVFAAMLNTLLLGFSISLGANAAYWIPLQMNDFAATQTCSNWLNVNGQAWGVPFFVLMIVPFNVLYGAHITQWPTMTLVAAVGVIVSTALTLNTTLPNELVTVVSSAAICITGSSITRVINHPPLVDLLSGLGMLTPGGLGARGAGLAFSQIGDTGFVVAMLAVAMEIAVGVFIAEAVFPKRKIRNRLSLI